MAPKAYGRMVFWEGACLWVLGKRAEDSPYPKTSLHSHHAVQVTLALQLTRTGGRWSKFGTTYHMACHAIMRVDEG